jgi:hypothetical protein
MNAPAKKLNVPYVLSFTEEEYHEFDCKLDAFYANFDSVINTVDLAYMACIGEDPKGAATKFEGFTTLLSRHMAVLMEDYESIEEVLKDARQRGKS